MCGGDRSLVNEMKEFAVSCLINEKPDQNHNTVIEALKGAAEQNPAIAEAANKIADRIAEKFHDVGNAPEKVTEKSVKFFNKNEYGKIRNKAFINTDSRTGFNIMSSLLDSSITSTVAVTPTKSLANS